MLQITLARHLPQDLPCQGPFSRKVLRFSGGPSMPGAIFLEGPAFFRWTNRHFAFTIHQNGSFGGRTWQDRGWFCQDIGRRACSWSSAENGGRAVIVDNFFSIVHIFSLFLYPGKSSNRDLHGHQSIRRPPAGSRGI